MLNIYDMLKKVKDVINCNISKGVNSGYNLPYKTSHPKISVQNVTNEKVHQAIFPLRNSKGLDVYGLKSSMLKLSAVYIVDF